jgi:hypothetical protein
MDYHIWPAGAARIGGLIRIPPAAAATGMPPAWLAAAGT